MIPKIATSYKIKITYMVGKTNFIIVKLQKQPNINHNVFHQISTLKIQITRFLQKF